MSQAGIVDVESSHPQIPTSFVTNDGTAIPIANTLEILGTVVAAHSIPLETTGSGNTVTVVAQYATSGASSVGNNAGLASFNSADFTVDDNGFVSSSSVVSITIDGDTGSASGSTITIEADVADLNCGSSVQFTASGSTVLLNVSDINNNTILGAFSGTSTASSENSSNTSLGVSNLTLLDPSGAGGNNNCAFGFGVLTELVDGNFNTAVGSTAGGAYSDNYLTAIGGASCSLLSSGAANTALGYESLLLLLTGSNNTAIGAYAGSAYTSSESSNIVIGNVGVVSESNVIRIGTQGSGDGEQDTCYIAGIASNSVSNLQYVTINTSTGQLGSSTNSSLVKWTVISSSQTMATNNGYICGSGSTLSLALPSVSSVGDLISITVDGSTGFTITQGAGQQIRIGNLSTTSGVSGSISSSSQGDTLNMVCSIADLKWNVISSMGNPTLV